ncbi:acyl-CoA thioesterase [Desulfobacter hydrogenophilus]|uniref:Acyl-CoA thioesterase n=1 Tax=Desulfobacter hydrogenophilus TaxID=2291 RepID=A0A328FA72_9BACT|nr:acyl-CoA thioesterase [Desulfobacter hydrogenophilus]NDY72600.1 acyl-CoA thioesterase [Desulfobacter hydrogenophilus]QBH13321.1 acyl-CoA thioesterase [Desulfobacter hydrogenophilus]RAM01279.1 acyl-CoA thioesterase [Desulfobacter hydrogenophilus]
MVKKNEHKKPVYKHFETEHKVPFHDMDPMHVMWHGNYYKYFDVTRFDLFKAAGVDLYEYSFSKQVSFPVSRSSIKHIAPLKFHDEFICKATVTEAEYKIGINFEIRLKETGQICARGKSEQVAVRVPEMTLLFRIPEDITSALLV